MEVQRQYKGRKIMHDRIRYDACMQISSLLVILFAIIHIPCIDDRVIDQRPTEGSRYYVDICLRLQLEDVRRDVYREVYDIDIRKTVPFLLFQSYPEERFPVG